MSILEVSGLKKTYSTRFGASKVEALRNVNFSVEQGEYVAIMGESGSGKTTLLNMIAALDKPTGGQDSTGRHRAGKDRRRGHIGISKGQSGLRLSGVQPAGYLFHALCLCLHTPGLCLPHDRKDTPAF